MKFVAILVGIGILINSFGRADYSKEVGYLQNKVANSSYNKEYGILIDYGLHSGKYRMFLVDLKRKETVHKFLISHGSGSESFLGIPRRFSNINGSNASSLGYSVISNRGSSRYGVGIKYILKGLDKTNSNLEKRNVVLHSYKTIPSVSSFPIPLIESQGCPTTSNKDLKWLDKFIQSQKNKRILIYSFK